MNYVTLNNGVKMPMVGFGVFEIPKEETARCVYDALEAGYRLIDTAQAYYNERGVGEGIRTCGVPREELCTFYILAPIAETKKRENQRKIFVV